MLLLIQAVPASDPSYLDALLHWVTSSSAAATSFVLNVISLLLAVAGFGLYFGQKREYRLLFGMLQEYGLKERVSADAKSAQEERARVQKELETTQEAIASAQKDLAERIPIEARRVYYENTIPVVQKQIFDLAKQLEQMADDYQSLGGIHVGLAPQINEVLSEEVRKHVSLRRDMEQSEGLLAILTGTTASIGIIAPFPFSLLAIPIAIWALREALRYYHLWRVYYGRLRKTSPAPTATSD